MLGHPQRHRGLAGAGIAGEAHVQRRRLRRQAHALADTFDQQQRRDLADAGLDRLQADQLAVELREDLFDADGFELVAKADRICHRGGIHVHLQTSARRRCFFGKKSVAASTATEQCIRQAQGTIRENASAETSYLTVAPAFRTVGGVGAGRVADVAAGNFLPLEAEAWLLLRPVDDEGQPHRFPAVAGIERRHADVAVAIHLAAGVRAPS